MNNINDYIISNINDDDDDDDDDDNNNNNNNNNNNSSNNSNLHQNGEGPKQWKIFNQNVFFFNCQRLSWAECQTIDSSGWWLESGSERADIS